MSQETDEGPSPDDSWIEKVEISSMDRYRTFFCLVCVILIMTTAQAWTDGASPSSENSYQPELPSPLGEGSEGLSTGKILAAQVSLFYGQNLDEVEDRIARLAEAGVNTLIVRVFQNEGDRPYRFASPQHATGVYFQTQYAPVVDDILAPVARIARQHGLRVFAWMTTRHANYGFEGNGALRAVLYDFETDTMVPARGFNLFRTEVITRLTGLYSDLARYPIDGILFQDDLILRHNEGFSPEARQLFFEDHGFMSHPAQFYSEISREDDGKIVVSRYTDRFWIWARWKNWKLMNLAERLMDAGRRIKPDLQFAINLYYESVLDPEKGMAWYSQSLEMARELPFDYFSIMAYHRQMREELELTMEEALNLLPHLADRAINMAGDPARVLMKIQVVDWNDSTLLPEEETEMALRAVGERPGIHIALVPYQPDLPTKSLIRSLDLPPVGTRQEGGIINPIATRELLPTSFRR